MKNNKISLKNNKGVTFLTLVISILMMTIIAGILVVNSKSARQIQRLKNMYNDIEILEDKVSNYYLKYGTIPKKILYTGDIEFTQDANDNNTYYVLDLTAFDGINLTYGEDFNTIKSSDDTLAYKDIYIINEQSHKIYYARGVKVEETTYYTDDIETNAVELHK